MNRNLIGDGTLQRADKRFARVHLPSRFAKLIRTEFSVTARARGVERILHAVDRFERFVAPVIGCSRLAKSEDSHDAYERPARAPTTDRNPGFHAARQDRPAAPGF